LSHIFQSARTNIWQLNHRPSATTWQCVFKYAQHICNLMMSMIHRWTHNFTKYYYAGHMQS
jgi:hypothetical protein